MPKGDTLCAVAGGNHDHCPVWTSPEDVNATHVVEYGAVPRRLKARADTAFSAHAKRYTAMV
jgi:hypothetical protein